MIAEIVAAAAVGIKELIEIATNAASAKAEEQAMILKRLTIAVGELQTHMRSIDSVLAKHDKEADEKLSG